MSFHLAVNTSQARAQLVLFNDDSIIDESVWEKTGSHSEIITNEFVSILKKNELEISELDRLFCVHGPGSFTGVRVGVSFCSTLAYSLDLPVFPINTLDLYAHQVEDHSLDIFSMIDAQKNCVFLSKFKWKNSKMETIVSNKVINIDILADELRPGGAICGNAHQKYHSILGWEQDFNLQFDQRWEIPDLKSMVLKKEVQWEPTSWKSLKPLYIKASAPEEKIKSSEST